MSVRLAPSILSADFAHLARDIAAVGARRRGLIHVDVMDGHFVPNITIGPPVVRPSSASRTVPLDVHLMIEDPDRYIDAFVDAGAVDGCRCTSRCCRICIARSRRSRSAA